MKTIVKYSSLPLVALLLGIGVNGCKKKTTPDPVDPTVVNKYSSLLMVGAWPNTAYYITQFPSLTEGTVNLQGNGAEITGKVYAQDIVQRKGYYYHANFGEGKFGKYHVENGVLITDQEVPFTYLNWNAHTWVNDETLVIFGTSGDGNEARYAVINVSNLQMTTGTLSLEAIPSGMTVYMLGFAEYRSNKIYLGYGFGSDDYTNYPTMDSHTESVVAAIDYPAMTVSASSNDTRSTGSGGSPIYAPCSFVDENGDIYYITDPVYHYDYVAPSAIYRVKNGENEIDDSYYFDFSATVSNGMGAAIWYIGNGKAIVRTRVAGQSIDTDHSFSLINVHTGSFIKTLDLPADKGERMVQAVVVEDGKAYIAVNASDRDYVWIYDPATDALTKGTEFVGGVDYVLRLEKLN